MKTFEAALSELKEIVRELESGNLTLDESIELFQKGVSEINFCHKKLEEVRKKVEILVENSKGALERMDYEPET
jgi:exodeoxyribonuclease VII small subunit